MQVSVISATVVSVLAVSARIPGSNRTVDGYLSTPSLKASHCGEIGFSALAINARVPRSNPTIDGYFSTFLKALGKPSRLL